MTLQELQHEVAKLTPSELAEFRAWLAEYDWQLWDKQIERDAAEGRLKHLAAEVLDDLRNGRCREL